MNREDRIALRRQHRAIEDAIEAHIAAAHPSEPYLQGCEACVQLEAREDALNDEWAMVRRRFDGRRT